MLWVIISLGLLVQLGLLSYSYRMLYQARADLRADERVLKQMQQVREHVDETMREPARRIREELLRLGIENDHVTIEVTLQEPTTLSAN